MTSLLAGGTFGPKEKRSSRLPGRSRRLGGDSSLPQRDCHPLHEVANGGFRDPVQERAIEVLANQSEGRFVSCTQPELGQVPAEGRDLQLTLQRRENSARPGGPPGDRKPRATGCANGWAQLDLHPLANLKPADRETYLREQLIPTFLR